MSAEFNFTKLLAKTKDEALHEGFDLIEQAAYDYGHSGYTGSFAECDGVEFVYADVYNSVMKRFDSVDAAEEYLDRTALKWGPMLIVAVGDDFYAGAWCSS